MGYLHRINDAIKVTLFDVIRHPSKHHWTKDHPLEQVIGNPSQSIRTRRQLETGGKMCMFTLTVSQTEPKNIKEAMANSAWIEAMQEELHQFDRLDEGINFEESFALVARLEAIKLFVAYAAHNVVTPMATKPLDADLSGTPVDQTKYSSMVGALMYLIASRPDIVHATCYYACYQARPPEKYLRESDLSTNSHTLIDQTGEVLPASLQSMQN
ncbi:hypothetical protein Tco_0736611 [Tanacetum coccineum]